MAFTPMRTSFRLAFLVSCPSGLSGPAMMEPPSQSATTKQGRLEQPPRQPAAVGQHLSAAIVVCVRRWMAVNSPNVSTISSNNSRGRGLTSPGGLSARDPPLAERPSFTK